MFKQERGITLIALVITIIVLLILAGVSIAMLTGENGILTQSQNSKVKSNDAETAERINMELNAQLTNAMTGKAFDTADAIESHIGTLPTGYSFTVTQSATGYSTSATVSVTVTKPDESGLSVLTGTVAYSDNKWTVTPIK